MESNGNENTSTRDDSDREKIKSELSKMSFEDLIKLKQKLGCKVYKETVLGVKSNKQTDFKRKNKNRPREASSKVKPVIRTTVKKENPGRDPRFDRLCGQFNEKHFQNTYGFLSDIRAREKTELKRLLKREKDPEEVNKIKYLIQRMENQEREEKLKAKKRENEERERQEKIKALESGKKPYFRTKYEKKVAHLVDKYSDLKKTGKIQKYIEKKQKKKKVQEKRKRYFEVKIPDADG